VNLIILGLSLLTNLTGFSSGISYETSNDHLGDALLENGIILNAADDFENKIIRYGDVYNLSGQNKYLEIELTNGDWILYDKSLSTTVDYFDRNPFNDVGFETLKLFDEENLGFDFAYYDQNINDFISLGGNNFSEKAIEDYFASQDKKRGNYYRDFSLTSNAHVIDNYEYFEKLDGRHAWNSLGTCTIVSTEILLGYYDTFASDLFVDESYEVISRQTLTNSKLTWKDFSQSPGVDNYATEDHDFHDYLAKIARDEVGDDPEIDGMTTKNQIRLVENYLNKRGISYSLSTSEGNLGDIWTQRAIGIIKSGIDENRPVIANGTGHSVVAYACDDEYVWVHTGWGWTGATTWATYESGLFANYSAGCIDIIYEGNHVHSDNYYSYSLNEYICPCGTKYCSISILPEDYGFEDQYFYYSKSRPIVIDDFVINTKRLRTGFIEEEYVNLSPKRQSAGEAYFELNFSKYVRKFSINLSYWQIKDVLSSLDSTAVLEIKQNGEWKFEEDLLSLNLSTDRTKQDEFIFTYIGEEIEGITIRMTAPASGDRNLGRISIGNLTLLHQI